MSLRRIFLRLLVAVFALNASGFAFSAERFSAGIAHDLELVSVPAGAGDGQSPASCVHSCQGHYAQHFTVLPSSVPASFVLSEQRAAPPDFSSRTPAGPASSLFRPPRTASR